ncbi:putative NHL repeat-containing protein 3, partial [Apostichopus japonicus]
RDKESSSILLFAQSGDYIQTLPIKSNTLEQVHGLTFHADTGLERYTLWATDVGNGPFGYTVKQYDLNGSLLRVLGTPGTAGSSLTPLQFGNVAEVAFDNKGLMYVVDGDGGLNNRLVKLNSNYSELWSFGQNGTGPLDFRIPHSVTVSPATGHIWVADRMNNRLKVFDPVEPKLVKSCQMDGGQPYSVRFSKMALISSLLSFRTTPSPSCPASLLTNRRARSWIGQAPSGVQTSSR